jgi:hypothetical protein
MGKFLEIERHRQAEFKAVSPYFSETARSDGMYKNKQRSFCLPVDCAEENLFPSIRQAAPDYFAAQGIKWHDGRSGKPSNHLCDSQVCCVNFLFPFADKPRALAKVLRAIFPDLREMLPVEDGQYVAFEWIGQKNYLGEKVSRSGKRTRGANFTSADAAVLFERNDGKRQMVLIEWKYTESYGRVSLKIARSGTDRTKIYSPLYLRDDCPLNKDLIPDFDSLFYEPFYQLMRQQLLAHEMEKAHELGANIVSVLHIAPARNTDFHRITSPELKRLGETATDVWTRLVRIKGRFISVSTERLFGNLTAEQAPEMQTWIDYIGKRYVWVQEGSRGS